MVNGEEVVERLRLGVLMVQLAQGDQTQVCLLLREQRGHYSQSYLRTLNHLPHVRLNYLVVAHLPYPPALLHLGIGVNGSPTCW